MPSFFMGIGHESAATFADICALAEQGCGMAGIVPADVALIATIDSKEASGLVADLGQRLGVSVRYFSAADLEAETPRLKNPSETVFRQLGCHGVAEAAALAAAGPTAELILPKIIGTRVTCAIARRGGLGG
jgi:cobalamin biosynthesis protein CbiG